MLEPVSEPQPQRCLSQFFQTDLKLVNKVAPGLGPSSLGIICRRRGRAPHKLLGQMGLYQVSWRAPQLSADSRAEVNEALR